jgi:hypothetical protein
VGVIVGTITSTLVDGIAVGISVASSASGVEVKSIATVTSVPPPHAVRMKKNNRIGMYFFIGLYRYVTLSICEGSCL